MNLPIRHLDLFSGIGGFALAADRVFGEVEHTFCEIDLFCQAVLRKHYPHSKIYGDIRELTTDTESRQSGEQTEQEGRKDSCGSNWDILTGGFPCQPFSQAGRRRGTQDDRYLWGEMFRVIQLTKPKWVIAENVRGLLTIQQGVVFQKCIADLEGEDYAVQTFVIPVCAVNAPHRRDRVWIVAKNSKHNRGRIGKYEKQRNIGDERDSRAGDAIGVHKKENVTNPISTGEGSAYRSEGGTSKRRRQEPNKREGSEVRSNIANGDTQCRNVADTANNGCNRNDAQSGMEKKLSENKEQSGSGRTSGSERCDSNASYPASGRCRQCISERQEESNSDKRNSRKEWRQNWLEVATRLCRVDDGLPKRMDRNLRLKALGNAIVPQIAEEIMKAINDNDRQPIRPSTSPIIALDAKAAENR